MDSLTKNVFEEEKNTTKTWTCKCVLVNSNCGFIDICSSHIVEYLVTIFI